MHKVRCMLKRMSVVCLYGMVALSFVACQENDEENIDPLYAVDLGLSVKWAWCNVGANRPKEDGSYYAWGETAAKDLWGSDKKKYQHYNSTTGAYKYLGSTISGTSYDVAHTTMSDDWRMPTKEELQELIDKCTWEWVTLYGDDYYTTDDEDTSDDTTDADYGYYDGFLITGPNGNHIFLPGGKYWSGTNESFGNGDPMSYVLSAGYSDNKQVSTEACYAVRFIRPVKGELNISDDNEDDASVSQSKTYTVNGVSFKMIGIEKGLFTMGATSEQSSSSVTNHERPTHQVVLSSYAIGETEVTQELWQAVMGSNPSGYTGNLQRPVEGVSWYDCQNFIYKLNQLTGENFRLPTEAEWEYAARGGFNSQRYVYSGGSSVHDVAWYFTNSDYETHAVKGKQANELAIYDMSGNVREWCNDWYGSYSSMSQTDPIGPSQGTCRVLRGGHYNCYAIDCRISSRSYLEPASKANYIGLRLAKSKSNVGVPTQLECYAVTGEASDITDSGATISGIVYNADKEVTCGIVYGTSENLSAINCTVVTTTAKGEFSVELTGLEPQTSYYYCAFVLVGEGEYRYGEVTKFETKKGIVTGDASNITDNGATIFGVIDIGQEAECGIIYGTSENLSSTNGIIANAIDQDEFFLDVTGLEANTIYYYCAFYVTEEGQYRYGEVRSFTTSKEGYETFVVNGVSFTMIDVEGGTFTMGATSEQGSDAYDDEKPTHEVTLSNYSIGETEVTQALWQAVMGSNPSYFTGDLQRPVEYVRWNECQGFISKLNELTGESFRLPTEAEWEYAARGGNLSQGYKYSGSNTIGDVAWYDGNSSSKTHPVKTKQPNELGIYDMSGNVWEWCSDWYGNYSSSAQTNPTGPSSGFGRVLRGGGWSSVAWGCRVACRASDSPDYGYSGIGLRLVR